MIGGGPHHRRVDQLTSAIGVAEERPMAAEPKEELTEGLKHDLWSRGPLLMDQLITLRNDVNQLSAASSPAANRCNFEDFFDISG